MIAPAGDRLAAMQRTREMIAASRPLAVAATAPAGACNLELRQACRALYYPHKTRRERAAAVLAAMRMRSKSETGPMPSPNAIPREKGDEIRAFVKVRLHQDPTLSGEKLRKEVTERFGVTINVSAFHVTYWKPVRQQLGLHKTRGGDGGPGKKRAEPSLPPARPAKPSAPLAPISEKADEIVPEKAPSPAPVNRIVGLTNGTGHDVPATTLVVAPDAAENVALREEIRSLRARYEAEEYIRLEQEDDRWVLRVNMEFDDPAHAVEALARVSLGLSRATPGGG